MRRLLSLLCLLPFSVSAQSVDLPDASGLPSVTHYPNAVIFQYKNNQKNNYPLISSAIKKVNGVVLADNRQWMDGQWIRVIYDLPEGHGSERAFHFFSEQLSRLGVTSLYQCESRHCGPSNLWANEVFGEADLYGLDQTQFYQLSARAVDGHTEYYVLYTVKRGNRRVYAMLDRLVVDAPFVRPEEESHGIAPGFGDPAGQHLIDVQISGDKAEVISHQIMDEIMALSKTPGRGLLLAGVSAPDTTLTLAEQLNNSRERAQMLKVKLMERGVDDGKLVVLGTGPLLWDARVMKNSFVRVLLVQ